MGPERFTDSCRGRRRTTPADRPPFVDTAGRGERPGRRDSPPGSADRVLAAGLITPAATQGDGLGGRRRRGGVTMAPDGVIGA